MPDSTRERALTAPAPVLATLLLAALILAAAAAALGAPADAALVLLLLAALPYAATRAAATGVLSAAAVLHLADRATGAALSRPFNPALDTGLFSAVWDLGRGTLGLPLTLATLAGAAALAAFALAVLWWATGRVARAAPRRHRPLILAAAVPLAVLSLHAGSLHILTDRAAATAAARADLAAFRAAAASDPYPDAPDGTLGALSGTDILIVLVKSYGRSALTDPAYAPTTHAALADAQADLAAAGLAMRSGALASPVTGGQSWLPRATLTTGLTVDSQARYAALLASPRRTLLHIAHAAGWQTAAVVPAITRPWPEGGFFGYDRILAAADLGYRGAPFNWVTMPDQFTLAATERLVLTPGPRAPVMAEIALISSHAPWTPIPPLLPWEGLGDGSVFTPYATAGDPPDVVWRDPARVRAQYRQSIDYSLRTVAAFLLRHTDRPTLAIVLGDHQPAPFVSGDPDGRDVPVHVIGPPALVARLDPWHWTPGLLPDPALAAWPMAAFRDRFLAAFAADPPAPPHPAFTDAATALVSP